MDQKKTVFFDRDGVINKSPPNSGYITRWDDFAFLPNVAKAIQYVNKKKYLVIVITNQRCISRGLIKESDLILIHKKMVEQLALSNAQVDDIFYCPHNVSDMCDCRKPKPGMIYKAKKKWNIDLANSIFIGDSDTDIQAGNSAGCHTYKVDGENDLLEVVMKLLP